MSSPSLNSFFLVQLNFLNIESGATLQVNCINRTCTTSNASWFPILKDITGIGAIVGEQLPRQSRGNIVINNSPKSLGAERKLSDLFDTYSLVNTEARFYLANTGLKTEPTVIGDLTEIWRGLIDSVQFAQGDNLRISFKKDFIPTRTMTRSVTRNAFPNAPESSLGRHLPLIFGNYSEVDAVIVRESYTESSENRIDIAYGTSLGNKFIPSGTGADAPILFYNNPISQRYEPVTFATNPTTPIYSQPSTATSDIDLWEKEKNIAYKLKSGQNVTGGELITGVNWYLGLSGSATGSGQYTCTIYTSANGYPAQEISKSICEINSARKQFLGVINGVNVYNFRFYFNKLVQVPIDGEIFIALSKSDDEVNFSPFRDYGVLSAFEVYRILSADTGAEIAALEEWERVVLTTAKDHFDVFGLAVTHDVSGGSSSTWQDGLGHVQMTLRMRDQENVPNLSREQFIVTSRGMKDDSSGSITGVANSLLSSGVACLACMLYRWDGSNWVSLPTDTRFSATWNRPYTHGIRGSTQGRTTQEQILNELAYNSAAKIIPSPEGKVAIYYMGTSRAPVGILEDEDITITGVEIQGTSNIINRFESVYYRRITQRLTSVLNEGGFRGYQGAFDSRFDAIIGDPVQVNRSISRFGRLEVGTKQFNFIGDLEPMRSIASIYLMSFLFPQMIITLESPYDKNGQYQLYDVVDVYSVNLPAEDGTSSDAVLPLSGTEENSVEIINGHYFKRQKKTRCIILGKDVILQKEKTPLVKYTLARINKGSLR